MRRVRHAFSHEQCAAPLRQALITHLKITYQADEADERHQGETMLVYVDAFLVTTFQNNPARQQQTFDKAINPADVQRARKLSVVGKSKQKQGVWVCLSHAAFGACFHYRWNTAIATAANVYRRPLVPAYRRPARCCNRAQST